MWPDMLGIYSMLPSRTLRLMSDFHSDPWAKKHRSRIGAYQTPKAKMSKHRKQIKKMRAI